MNMKKQVTNPFARAAILALAEIQAATQAFDRGDTNAFDTLDAVAVAVDTYRALVQGHREAA